MKVQFKLIFGTVALVVILALITKLVNGITTATTKIKVIEKVSQQQISGEETLQTTYRYLIVSDTETFVVESNWMKMKFDNSHLFFHLKQDSVYTVEVTGIGKTPITDYRNIIKIIK